MKRFILNWCSRLAAMVISSQNSQPNQLQYRSRNLRKEIFRWYFRKRTLILFDIKQRFEMHEILCVFYNCRLKNFPKSTGAVNIFTSNSLIIIYYLKPFKTLPCVHFQHNSIKMISLFIIVGGNKTYNSQVKQCLFSCNKYFYYISMFRSVKNQ